MDFLKRINFISPKISENSNETKKLEKELIIQEAIVKVENKITEISYFTNVTQKSGIFLTDLSARINDNFVAVSIVTAKKYNESANRVSDLSDSAINLTSEFKNTLVEFKTDISNKYDQIEIKSNLLKIISTLDCDKIVASLEYLKNEHLKNKDPKIIKAISITQLIILTLDRHNKAIESDQTELNWELNSILNSVDIIEVLNIIEPFCHLFPYGGTVIIIIKLFVK